MKRLEVPDDFFDWDSAWEESVKKDTVKDFLKYPQKYKGKEIEVTNGLAFEDMMKVTMHNLDTAISIAQANIDEAERLKKEKEQKKLTHEEIVRKKEQELWDEVPEYLKFWPIGKLIRWMVFH